MAEFNVTPQAQPPVNYTGASQGINASPNTALGTLFSGLAETLDSGVKEADRYTQETIRNDIFDESDKINDEFGVGDATTFQEDAEGPQPRPAQLQSSGENLERLQTAYERGALKESHYWARMNAMVRQLRTRYPGYRGEIDEMVSGITGAKPANALRNSLFNEWAAKTADQPLPKLEDWAVKNGRLPGDYYQRAQGQTPYSLTELQAYIANKTRQDSEVADTRAQIALASDQGTLNTTNVEKAYRVESNQFVTSLISDTTSTIGQTYQVLQERIRDAQNQQQLSQPVDTPELLGALNQLEGDVMLALQQKFTESWDGNAQHSYVSNLSTEQRDAAIKQAMTPITILKSALTAEAYGLVNAVAANTKARENTLDRAMVDSMPVLEELSVLQNRVGPAIAGLVLQSSPQGQTALVQSLFDFSAARAANKLASGSTASISDAYAKGVEASAGGDYYNGLITQWTKIADQVTKGELPLEVVQSNVQYMFGPESNSVLAAMDDASKFEYFRKVSSPQVTKQMIALKNLGDADSWATYQQWTTNAFMSLFQQSVQDLNAVNTNASFDGLNVRWDGVSKGFVIKSTGMFGVGGFEAPAREFNTALRTIAPIIEENGGDVEQEVYALLTSMGFDGGAKRDKTFVDHLLESLTNSLGGATLTPEEGAPSLTPGGAK